MKAAPHQVSGILSDPAPYAGILLFGEDRGLIHQRAKAVTQSVIGPQPDPFRETVLAREDHRLVREAVASRSLSGGRRVVRIQDASDALAAPLETMAAYREDTLVILEAGSLTPKSKLRAMAEKLASWASIACYADTGRALTADIIRVLADGGLKADPDTLTYLAGELGGDSHRRRAELEKLVLFAAGQQTLTLEQAHASCATTLDASLGDAVSAALQGQIAACDACLAELAYEGATGPGLLAVLAGQVLRLLKVRLSIDSGRNPEEACRALYPPLYPSQAAAFLRTVERWNAASLENLGRFIREADIACKRAASPDFAIASRLLVSIAARRSPR